MSVSAIIDALKRQLKSRAKKARKSKAKPKAKAKSKAKAKANSTPTQKLSARTTASLQLEFLTLYQRGERESRRDAIMRVLNKRGIDYERIGAMKHPHWVKRGETLSDAQRDRLEFTYAGLPSDELSHDLKRYASRPSASQRASLESAGVHFPPTRKKRKLTGVAKAAFLSRMARGRAARK